MQRGLDGKSSKTMEAMKQPSKETLKKIRDISAIEVWFPQTSLTLSRQHIKTRNA